MLSPKKQILARNELRKSLRHFFESHHFIEVETPVLVPCPGTELHLDYFQSEWTDHSHKKHRVWLRSSPELALKRVMSMGLSAVYQIGPSFRNGGELSEWHHPEFTMLEYYQVGKSWKDFINLSEDLIRHSVQSLSKNFAVALDLKESVKISVYEAFKNFLGVDLMDGDPDLASKAREKGVLSVRDGEDFETAFFKILLEKIEPELEKLQWVLLYDYPPSQAALAKVEEGRAKRFEFYLKGVELSNGFYELCDPKLNEERIADVHSQRETLGKQIPDEDFDFYKALERGLPECYGNALGFDRLLALILGEKSISSVLPFRKDKPFGGV